MLAPGAIVGVLSSETIGQPRSGLGAYSVSKAALEESLRCWHNEHPNIRFSCVAVGSTVPTEFGNSFDLPLLGDLMSDWALHGLAQAEFMDTDEVGDFLVHMYAAALPYAQVNVEHLVLRSPSGLMGDAQKMMDHAAATIPVRCRRAARFAAMAPFSDLRVVEGSAFVAAPLGGLTLAQLGADVIRFDTIGGGLDYARWPVTDDDVSLYWNGLNKGKRSIAINLSRPEGRELATALITAPGENAGLFLSNFPESGWLSDERLRALRPDLVYVNVVGNPDETTAVDYTVNAASGIALATGPVGSSSPVNHALPAWDIATGSERGDRAPRRGAATARHRRGAAREDLARRRRVHDGREPRVPRPGADDAREPAAARQRHVRRVRSRLPHRATAGG